LQKAKAKNAWIPIMALIVCFFLVIIMFDDIGLSLFNILFGNNTYAIRFKYSVEGIPSNSYAKSLKFIYTVELITVRVPIETRLMRREIKELGEAVNMTNRTVTITLPITIATQVSQLFSESFTFYDTKPRQFIFYLNVQKGDVVNFVIRGTYTLEAIGPASGFEPVTLEIPIGKVFIV